MEHKQKGLIVVADCSVHGCTCTFHAERKRRINSVEVEVETLSHADAPRGIYPRLETKNGLKTVYQPANRFYYFVFGNSGGDDVLCSEHDTLAEARRAAADDESRYRTFDSGRGYGEGGYDAFIIKAASRKNALDLAQRGKGYCKR